MKLFYKWNFLRRIFKYTSLLVQPFNNRIVKNMASIKHTSSPIFIIGVPRSGTTFLYQLLTNYFNLLYTSNFIKLGRENLYFAFWLFNKIYRSRPHNCFRSKYGKTDACGLLAPNEDAIFWTMMHDKLFYTSKKRDLNAEVKTAIRNNILAIQNKFNKPIILKNLRIILHGELLKELFPNAKLIYLQRDPVYTSQSIFKAISDGKGKIMEDWLFFHPKGYEEIINLPEHKKVVKYIYLMSKQIENSLKLFPKNNIYKIRYKDIGNDLTEILDTIGKFGGKLNRRERGKLPEIKIRNKRKISSKDLKLLEEEVNKLDWDFN